MIRKEIGERGEKEYDVMEKGSCVKIIVCTYVTLYFKLNFNLDNNKHYQDNKISEKNF